MLKAQSPNTDTESHNFHMGKIIVAFASCTPYHSLSALNHVI